MGPSYKSRNFAPLGLLQMQSKPISNIMRYDRGLTHRVILDRVHRLLVKLSYFWPDRFVQLLSLIPILILLLYLLVSGC